MPQGYVHSRPRPLGHFRCLIFQPRCCLPGAEGRRKTGSCGPFNSPAEEEQRWPLPDQKQTEEPTAVLEEEKMTQQPNLRSDAQKAAEQ
ncbi:hypothetical protein NDU88_002340 [Pleurodeles waltl]|uniref:Uncharacterized protein n=1 Tax=Pleurodeles waltl TaxID=8319 RepID=A0AAV7UXC9_PLEWA|nr:hypothetical protein NDU88_002340 [Pleurodeles waltl]